MVSKAVLTFDMLAGRLELFRCCCCSARHLEEERIGAGVYSMKRREKS